MNDLREAKTAERRQKQDGVLVRFCEPEELMKDSAVPSRNPRSRHWVFRISETNTRMFQTWFQDHVTRSAQLPAKKVTNICYQLIHKRGGGYYVEGLVQFQKGYYTTEGVVKDILPTKGMVEKSADPDTVYQGIITADRWEEWGIYDSPSVGHIQRNTAKRMKKMEVGEKEMEIATEMSKGSKRMGDFIREDPSLYSLDWSKIERVQRELRNMEYTERKREMCQDAFDNFCPWQKQIFDHLNQLSPQDRERKFHVIVDERGGTGKSYFIKGLQSQFDTLYLGGGKAADLKLAGANHPNPEGPGMIALDITKGGMQYVSWHVLEKMQGGQFMSSKYNSREIFWPNKPIVVLVTNEDPPLKSLTFKRWDIFTLIPGFVLQGGPPDPTAVWRRAKVYRMSEEEKMDLLQKQMQEEAKKKGFKWVQTNITEYAAPLATSTTPAPQQIVTPVPREVQATQEHWG